MSRIPVADLPRSALSVRRVLVSLRLRAQDGPLLADSDPRRFSRAANRPRASTTASPIRRMSTSVGTAGGSLADDSCTEELAALVEHATSVGDGWRGV